MNVIIANRNQAILAAADIDVIKSIQGEFSVDDIISQFSNFYCNKIIIDITAIKDYQNINTIQKLSVNLDTSKIILLLDDSQTVNSPVYLSQLVSMGIYNFATNVNDVKYLINNPNSYGDVVGFQNIDGFKKVTLNDFSKDETKGKMGQKVIGFKNVTDHAGATTLVYLLKIHLENNYKVKAVEVDGNDFMYFNDKSLDSVSSITFTDYLNQNIDCDAILVDLNDSNVEDYCTDIVYLIEPGRIQLNKLIRKDSTIFEKLHDKKIVLNRSVLSDKDVEDFEKESRSKVFFNLPYLDDKIDNQQIINIFLSSLGFSRIDTNNGSGIFSVFK